MNKKLHFKGNRKLFLSILLVFIGLFLLNTPTLANYSKTEISQLSKTVTLNIQNGTIKAILIEIQKQTRLSFVYKDEILKSLGSKSITVEKESVESVLKKLFKGTDLTFSSNNNIITITREVVHKTVKPNTPIAVNGKILNKATKTPIVGATVTIVGKTTGAITGDDGSFSFSATIGEEIEVSYVGTKPLVVKVTDKSNDLVFFLESDALAVDDVVVTGIFTRKKESFTGSSSTFNAGELKQVGGQNLIQSLKTLDPSFNVMESREFGSDPNRLPDIEIRGKSSVIGLKEQFGTDPNQPLFILDGFETDLKTIVDLNMDRVASVTLLKDAASTAIYGSKAANGVVVIETKQPEKGKFRVTYSGNMYVSMPDLSDYNLMNSQEKLQFELEAGRYEAYNMTDQLFQNSLYNLHKLEVERGVDTYWINEPLRTAVSHKHNVYAEGGDEAVRYGVGVSYNSTAGVMKNSGNDLIGANFDLVYRKGKFSLSNKMNFDYYTQEDPITNFSEYTKANPYFRKTDERYLELYYSANKTLYAVTNPLYNSALNSFKKNDKMSFEDKLNAEFKILPNLILRGRFSIGRSATSKDDFTSPRNPMYDNTKYDKKGSYLKGIGSTSFIDGDFTLSYSAVVKKHQITAVLGAKMRSDQSQSDENTSVGFPIGSYDRPSFSSGYDTGSKPLYNETTYRSNSFYFNGGYVFDSRYLLDMNLRMDGASVFGSNKRYTDTWAVGLAWNFHNEKFMRDVKWINLLKFRASIGNPGNQNFNAYQSYTTYVFNRSFQNPFGTGMSIQDLGNPDLKWQKTIDQNIGFDLAFLENRLSANFDYYVKDTDPLLAQIAIPSSVGVKTIYTNMGAQKTKGLSGTIKYSPIFRPAENINWSLSATFKHQTAEYRNIGNSLNQYNKENMGKSFVRYYDGGSPTSLWAVRSLGINPADGREVFMKKDGTRTFDYDANDQIEIGNSDPKIDGVLGSVLYYKGFSFSIYFKYSFGADVFNKATYEKVENLSLEQLKYNQDKRALYDRWRKPGDIAKFKGISLTDETPMTSRFILRENYIKAESISFGYDFKSAMVKRIGIESLRLQANMNDLFRISTIKEERGTEYPFARQFSVSLSVMF